MHIPLPTFQCNYINSYLSLIKISAIPTWRYNNRSPISNLVITSKMTQVPTMASDMKPNTLEKRQLHGLNYLPV